MPNPNSTPSDSVKAYGAYRISIATNDLFTLCLEEIGKLSADQVTIDRKSQITEAKAKFDRLIALFEKWWSVGITHAWQTGERNIAF